MCIYNSSSLRHRNYYLFILLPLDHFFVEIKPQLVECLNDSILILLKDDMSTNVFVTILTPPIFLGLGGMKMGELEWGVYLFRFF